MTQKLISDAKRRARAESRETGRSYQSLLEDIAHRAGRNGWSAFLLDPAEPIPTAPAVDVPVSLCVEPADADRKSARQPRIRSGTRRVLAAALLLIIGLSAWTAWDTWRRAVIVSGLNAAYGDERSAAIKMLVPEIATDRDAYVAAWRLPGDRRRIYLTYMDWRPVVRGTVSDAIHDTRVRLGYDRVYVTGARDHPVFRIQAIVDCRTSTLTTTGGYLADDYVGRPAIRMGAPRKPVILSASRRDAMCSSDALDRTKHLKALSEGSFPIIRA